MARHAEVAKVMRLIALPPTREGTDRELLAQYIAGDEAAFATLVARHGGLVLGVCRRVLPTVQDAEDACQAVFLILAQKAKTNCWQPSIANWLYTTAWQVASKAKRSAYRRSKKEAQARVSVPTTPLDHLSWREGLSILDEELSRLPSRYREPLILCYLEGLTRDEAATQLAVPIATLKSQLDRARKRLNNALARRGLVPGLGLLAIEAVSPANASPRLIDSLLMALKETPSSAVAEMMKGIVVNSWIKKTTLSLTTMIGLAAIGATAFALRAQPEPTPKVDTPPTPKVMAVAEDEKPMLVSGKVVDPDGKPLAGVKLYTYTPKKSDPVSDDETVRLLGMTAEDGSFQMDMGSDFKRGILIATHEGFGVAWRHFHHLPKIDLKAISIKLAKDVPITGQILNGAGKPAADVRIKLMYINDTGEESLDSYLAIMKKRPRHYLELARGLSMDELVKPVQTDDQGRFTLAGAGSERIAVLNVEGKGVARTTLHVVTRRNFDATSYNEILNNPTNSTLKEYGYNGLFSPDFRYEANAGIIAEGIIRESVTGMPLAGCRVSIRTDSDTIIHKHTGVDGRYRFEGISTQLRNRPILVEPPAKSGFLRRIVPLPIAKSGNDTVHLDIPLPNGTLVKGRITDKATGKGVKAVIRFIPLAENKYFDSQPGFDIYRHERTVHYQDRIFDETDSEGRFAIPTIPGPSLMVVQAFKQEKFQGHWINTFLWATPDLKYPQFFQKEADGWKVKTAIDTIKLSDIPHQACKVIDLIPNIDATINIALDGGFTKVIEIQDKLGKPIKGVRILGIASLHEVFQITNTQTTIYAVSPTQPRQVVIYHPDLHLAGSMVVRGDEKGELSIRLGDMATAKGHIVQPNGTPLKGAQVRIVQPFTRFLDVMQATATTDEEGRFTLSQVFPDAEFWLSVSKDGTPYKVDFHQYYPGPRRHTLKPGEIRDLGASRAE